MKSIILFLSLFSFNLFASDPCLYKESYDKYNNVYKSGQTDRMTEILDSQTLKEANDYALSCFGAEGLKQIQAIQAKFGIKSPPVHPQAPRCNYSVDPELTTCNIGKAPTSIDVWADRDPKFSELCIVLGVFDPIDYEKLVRSNATTVKTPDGNIYFVNGFRESCWQ